MDTLQALSGQFNVILSLVSAQGFAPKEFGNTRKFALGFAMLALLYEKECRGIPGCCGCLGSVRMPTR
jgi:hypothetical protein